MNATNRLCATHAHGASASATAASHSPHDERPAVRQPRPRLLFPPAARMKIKVLSRSAEECTRERACDLARVFRNPDPALHPFERAREYTRSLNAAKLDRARLAARHCALRLRFVAQERGRSRV